MLNKVDSNESASSSADPKPLLDNDGLDQEVNQQETIFNGSDLNAITPRTLNNQKFYTNDEAISLIGSGKFQLRLMFLTGGIWAADAMEMMLLSFVMPILQDEWDLGTGLDGAISAVVFAGMLCGVAFWSILADCIGRKKCVIYSNLGCAIFGVLSGLSPNIWFMLAARFCVGFRYLFIFIICFIKTNITWKHTKKKQRWWKWYSLHS